ncbi:MAG: hypothetical protein K9H64_07855 [Bacteroidales bacterium]|nr:hypothetical protein [Bacteroidales bacterium]MCF8455645.1 hypothetical protein [Bacteroidales bacterium]
MRRLLVVFVVLLGAIIGYQFVDMPHGSNFKISCSVCHSPESWKLDTAIYSFDHNTTNLPLVGEHTVVNCRECHPSLIFSDAGNQCNDCHADLHQNTLGEDCNRCHTPFSWLVGNISEIHQTSRFPLFGAHAMADCRECHTSDNFLVFEPMGVECFDCHQKEYMATTFPDHSLANYSQDCSECHNIYAYEWGASGFNHNFFPLTQGHYVHDCNECHNTKDYSNTSDECFSCHQEDYNSSKGPNHVQLGIDRDCSVCHTTIPGWSPALFPNHNETYVFNGAHTLIASDCFACHNPDFSNTPNTCIGCHESDYLQPINPNHLDADFDTECLTCHTEITWTPSTYDHSPIYAFTGAHIPIAKNCLACHQSGYLNTPNTCFACHTEDYNTTNEPPHASVQFPTDCESCHSTSAWEPSSFDHNQYYVFTGAHIPIANNCLACHQNGYPNTPTTCYECHTSDYNSTNDPPHLSSQLSTDCESCHNTSAWEPSSFDHNQYFVFTGAHIPIANNCLACHQNGYPNTPTTCIGCHQSDYNSTNDPPHASSQFSTECETCHTTSAWEPANFDHNQYWTLTGAHVPIANNCLACHQNGYPNTPTACVGCHQNDYNTTNDPSHVNAQFSTDCETCHTTSAWDPSSFNHNQYWTLTGAHVPIANNCLACHQNGYPNTPTDCVGCHQSDYNATNDPPHASSQFSTDCAACHTTSVWDPSTFNHQQYFPIYSGHHNGEWNSCTDCHTTPGNYEAFSCVNCHEHFQAEMDDEHDNVSGYVWESNACYACHPTGSEK